MPVPSTIADLSTTAASNSPAGTESIGTNLDNYLRAVQAIVKQNASKGVDIASASNITIPDAGSYFVVTGTTTIATIADSWNGRFVVLKFSGALQLTHSANLILPGSANITTVSGDVFAFVNESTGVWRCVCYQPVGGYLTSASIGVTVQAYDADTAKTDVAQTFTAIQTWSKGADVASANALTLGNDGNYFDITGTTAITSIGTKGVGTVVKLHFDASLTLTHNATDLVLPGGADITTAAGDEAEFFEYATGDWRCTCYTKASGTAVVSSGGITLGTAVASTSGTAIDFTGIPSGVKRITVIFSDVSLSGASSRRFQLGDSGGIETSGYDSMCHLSGSTTYLASSTGFDMYGEGSASYSVSGHIVFDLINASTNTWVATGQFMSPGYSSAMFITGEKSLSATLDRVRVTTTNGTDTFDAGTINISYE